MKNVFLFFLTVTLLAAAGCKKTVDCGMHGHAVNGSCVCDSFWSGKNCDIASRCLDVKCETHSHCVNGTCVCDSFWSGVSCSNDYLCATVHCGPNRHCLNGVCLCNTGWTGANCDISTACLNVNCGVHGHCVLGVCQCDSGWGGANCDISCATLICGTNSHCVNGTCVCDTGWVGTNCDRVACVPVDGHVGNYHMAGIYRSSSSIPGSSYNTIDTIDAIMTISKIDNSTLSFNGGTGCAYSSSLSTTNCVYFYDYGPPSGHYSSQLTFSNTSPDSVYYHYTEGSHFTSTSHYLTGVKIH